MILTGYHINENIYQGTRTQVYRGTRINDNQPVIIKVLRNHHPNFNELVQFRNQYTITRHLDHPGVVKPLALERYGNGYALIMPDSGASSLANYWHKCDRSLSKFLHIAIQLAEVLHYLNQQRIIHKDIKPANILICPQTHQIKLIDFSISSLLPQQQQQLINPNILEGTLAYISPEQTGRMNRGIDYRSDFYSLGVTFYELLTGQLPFTSEEPMELIHCHIAKMPILGNREEATGNREQGTGDSRDTALPCPLSEIVLKLMAKNAEDRYQSALGLKFDLEECLHQLETTGEITGWEIGQRDICSRFTIPEKLYGREAEVKILLDAFERVAEGATEMMLVAGFSGIGKTAAVNEVHKPIVRQRGYFIKGKFDQFNRNTPFSAFVQAFRDLMKQLLSESDVLLKNWKTKILQALGENGQVIVDVVPELELMIGRQPSVPELSGSAAQNRFNLMLRKFFQVFTNQEHPLAIFLDDLQWADSASLNLLKLLMDESSSGYLLFLGAYRDNEVFPAHPLMLTLKEIQKSGASFNTLTLKQLSEDNINHLVADTLRCPPELAKPLAQLVYQKTQGNPFFTTQFLQGLYEDGYITFDANALYWQCNLTQVRQLSLTSDVVEFMVERLRKLSKGTQSVLKLAACMGSQFDLKMLAVVCSRSVSGVAADLWQGLQERFVVPENETYKLFQVESNEEKEIGEVSVSYRFLHDRIQQAAYALIPDSEKPTTHLKIGQLLLNQLSEAERQEKIFDLVNQLNYGVQLITEPEEREQLAWLNLAAGTKAKAATAYRAAENYFAIGRELLQTDCWQSQYQLTLALCESAAEAAYLNGEFEQMEELIDRVLHWGRSLLDRIKVHEVKLQAYTLQKQFVEAIETALTVLKLLGVEFPASPTSAAVEKTFAETKSLWSDRPIQQLIDLPEMTDPEKKAALRILDAIISPAYIARPQFLPLIVCEQVKLLIKNGNAPNAAFAYGNYGLSLAAVVGDIESGYQFGKLASRVLSKFNAKEITAKVVVCTDAGIKHWKESARETINPLFSAYQVGLETGDVIFATYCAFYGICNSYFVGKNLIELQQEIACYSQAFRELKQETVFYWCELHRQVILNLVKPAGHPGCLEGEAYKETQALPFHQRIKDNLAIHLLHSHKLILNYLFESVDAAVENAAIAETYLDGVAGLFVVPAFYFYDSLARLRWLNHFNHQDNAQREIQLAKVAANQQKMQKWASHAPMNHLHKWHLVEAEKYRVLGNKTEAIEFYDLAIAGAKKNEYIQEEALANELAAKFYLDWGKEKIATVYMTDAYYGYARWGAKVKTDHLEAKYPQLLLPILQQQFESKPFDRTTFITQTIAAIKQTNTSTTSISDTLDFASLLQAAQALSDPIELNPLLADICRIILTNSGAHKAALLIPENDRWQLRAIAHLTSDGTVETNTNPQPLTVESPVPIRLIHYVKNTQKPVLINEAKTEITGIIDGEFLTDKPESILCFPLLNQGHLEAIIYLEHPTTKGIFTFERQTIIQFLCTQAAIALKNAQLYEQAQQAIRDLQQAQLQLVQSEKLSALGNLMAGVAHEINNPTGFLKGNIQPAQEYLKDLLGLIDLYQAQFPNPGAALESEIEAIDLEFIREDFPELLASMNQGIERIRNISKSLRIFARKDREAKTNFKLHEGIDSTLLILKHRTKANERRPEIKIVKNYQEIPEVQCFPGQLNQVFMNILANAIDAFESANIGRSYDEIKANPNCITIQTSVVDEKQVQIRIKDNGCGMTSETQARIFEQGFTTKEVGKGTGLGMAIARQIVEEKHGGTIECESELGQGTTFTITLPISASGIHESRK